MAYAAITKEPVPPMPARVSAWSIYRVFECADELPVFIGIISEKHWERFCEAFERQDWWTDERLTTNNDRIAARDWFLPEVEQCIANYTKAAVIARCEEAGIPFAPIARPEDLFEDPQLIQGGSLLSTRLPDGTEANLPGFPLEYGGEKSTMRLAPPAIGSHTREILTELGYSAEMIEDFIRKESITCD